MTEDPTLAEVSAALKAVSEARVQAVVTRETLLRWMASDDLEALGAAYLFVSDRTYYAALEKPLGFRQAGDFVLIYLGRCIAEDPAGDWSHSRFEAGREVSRFFKAWWAAGGVDPDFLAAAQRWLAGLYRGGNPDVRDCLITATLEHLFEDADIAAAFRAWRDDPVLGPAYEEALDHAGKFADLASEGEKDGEEP
jgi:hypothetical protein